jgi:hypothetical protein
VRRVSVAERRARLGRRHRLAPAARAADPVQVARSLVALHGTDPATVYLSVWARLAGDGDVGVVDRALYDERTLVRLLGMRRTVFVVAREVAPLVQAACSHEVAARERRKLVGFLVANGIDGDADAWLASVEEAALEALAARGEATATELGADDERLRHELVLNPGKRYEGRQRVGSRVLLVLAADGHVVRARPRGGWTSTQFRWAPSSAWCPGLLEGLAGDAEAAEAALARRWLEAFGPATAEDLRWWTGWTVRQTRRALAALEVVEADLEGVPGWLLADDVEPEADAGPWTALLPALDPTTMGWAARDWYLGPHGPLLFDATGNAGPTVWCDGRVVGGWAHRADGSVAVRVVDDVGAEAVAAIEAEAHALAARIGDVRLTPRARGAAPLERELLA